MKVKHVFVLVMENRSFDHLFAFSGLPGVAPPDARWGLTDDAPDRAVLDPPHDFASVRAQIGGDPPMSGFSAQTYGPQSRQSFAASDLPVLRALAEQFFLFDNWYSSMPGPTWPNRFFVHAASSGGLDDSPSAASTIESETIDSLSFTFQNGTLFERLEAAGRKWRVYHDDLFPQVLAIKSMIDPFRINTDHFSWLRQGSREFLVEDLNGAYDIDYTFIEPNYGLGSSDFQSGNCQHPTGSMAAGENFIKYVYETIRNSPVWSESLLLITYDEHGGFFDSQVPPPAAPPGDGTQNRDRAPQPQGFEFDRLGVRVPTIAISPWIARGGIGSQVFPGRHFDHTAIIRSVMELFAVTGSLTARDAAAASLLGICSLAALRDDADAPQHLPPATTPPAEAAALADTAVPDTVTSGFSRIAMSLDLSMTAHDGVPPVALVHPAFTAPLAPAAAPLPGDAASRAPRAAAPAPMPTQQQTLNYIASVADRVQRHRSGAPQN